MLAEMRQSDYVLKGCHNVSVSNVSNVSVCFQINFTEFYFT